MSRGLVCVLMSMSVMVAYSPAAFCADQQLNFKIYSPDTSSSAQSADGTEDAGAAKPSPEETAKPAEDDAAAAAPAPGQPAQPAAAAAAAAKPSTDSTLQPADASLKPADGETSSSEGLKSETPVPAATDKSASGKSDDSAATADAGTDAASTDSKKATADAASTDASDDAASGKGDKVADKVLQGYVRVVPSGTKCPIIMDTAVDSDTSQEGDEFEARTAEDLTIDGQIAVPAGSIIKGRIAQLNPARRLDRCGSVALKFDTVTTPDNRQIPLVANLVAHGGVVHARRGAKDILIDVGTFSLPTAAGLGIGAVAGNASSSLGVAGGALIGAGVGAAVGIAILLAKKGKKVDVRPGDELKIELAEDLRMPMM